MPGTARPFDAAWRPRGREDVDFRRVGENWVLFDPRAQRIHVLDATGALVWSRCTGDTDVAALEREIRGAFGAAFRDGSVAEALASFRAAGLLHGEPG